jgi:hypothetical protein
MTPGSPLTLSPSQLLLEIATGHQHDSEADKVDLTPLKDLISGRTVGPDDGDRSSRARASPKGKAVCGEKDEAEGRAEGNAVVLNTASAQRHSLETRSRTDWPVLEIITLRFPTVESPHFTVSLTLSVSHHQPIIASHRPPALLSTRGRQSTAG